MKCTGFAHISDIAQLLGFCSCGKELTGCGFAAFHLYGDLPRRIYREPDRSLSINRKPQYNSTLHTSYLLKSYE